jgi:recombination protein RecR
MNNLLPKSLEELIDALGALPGVGVRTAERYAYYLLKHTPSKTQHLSESLANLHKGIHICPKTFALIDSSVEISPLYNDPKRDKSMVAVVAEPFDIIAIEKTGGFHGTYHVLGGLISPIDNVHPEDLTIPQLIARIQEDGVKELIFATNASIEGETTVLYIQRQLADATIKISRLARGLPVGLDLEYADQLTLTRALEGRTAL